MEEEEESLEMLTITANVISTIYTVAPANLLREGLVYDKQNNFKFGNDN